MDSATANPHLNIFEPYRELGRTHEDQLTRAAMIVLRLVPLARETLLRAIGERSLSELPDSRWTCRRRTSSTPPRRARPAARCGASAW